MSTVLEHIDRAAVGFLAAANSHDPGPAFAYAMRAACRGFVSDVLPAADYQRLVPLIDAAERSLARADPSLVPGPDEQAANSDTLDDLMRFWAETAERRQEWHPDFVPGLIALVLQVANRVEDGSLNAIAVRGVRHRPTCSVERAPGRTFLDFPEKTDADVPHAPVRH
ncbi:hypothetical protein ACFZ8E_19065 [Methylobacterium sp. HMF5984]|uniref:hypothetical protein n=1 Tax=Methylobacterium sp. HMF5984 TaxID=3367370 RepID=UPI0038528AEE